VTKLTSFTFLALITSSLLVNASFAATVYTYKDRKGHIFITNKAPKKNQGFKVIKKVSFRPYRDRTSSVYNPYFEKIRSSKYDGLITDISKQHDIDRALVKSVVHIESAFQHEAVSRAGALGLMQLMPATAASYDLTENHFDPKSNLTVGITHLKYLLDRYNNDKRLSLAAYNAGETAVAKYGGIPPFEETQNYVVKVMGLYGKYRNNFSG